MTADVQSTAKIYQFPVGGRRTIEGRREQSKPATELVSSTAVCGGGGWYHEAAIQDAKRAREH
jgi:hypothetical protein